MPEAQIDPAVAERLQQEVAGMSAEQKAEMKAGVSEVLELLGSADDLPAFISNDKQPEFDPLFRSSSSRADATKMLPDAKLKDDDLIYAVLDAKTSHHRLHDIFQVKPGQEPVLNFMSVLFYGEAEAVDVKKAEMSPKGVLTLTLVDDRIVPVGPTQQFTGVLVNHNAKIKEIRVRGYAREATKSLRLQRMMDGILKEIDK